MIKKYTYNRLLRKSLPKIFIGDWVSPQGVDHSGRFFSGLALRERERTSQALRRIGLPLSTWYFRKQILGRSPFTWQATYRKLPITWPSIQSIGSWKWKEAIFFRISSRRVSSPCRLAIINQSSWRQAATTWSKTGNDTGNGSYMTLFGTLSQTYILRFLLQIKFQPKECLKEVFIKCHIKFLFVINWETCDSEENYSNSLVIHWLWHRNIWTRFYELTTGNRFVKCECVRLGVTFVLSNYIATVGVAVLWIAPSQWNQKVGAKCRYNM